MRSLLTRLQRDLNKAPGLRVSTTQREACGECAHFGYAPGRSWSGDGECYLYDVPVRDTFVCDSFVYVDDVDEEEAPPSGKRDGKSKRAAAVRNPGPRQVMTHDALNHVDVRLLNQAVSNLSTADLLAELNASDGVTKGPR